MNDLAGMMSPNIGLSIGPGHSHTAVELFEAGFGTFMVPVRPNGKKPGRLGADGHWRGVSSVTAFCASRDEAIEWDKEGASVGFAAVMGFCGSTTILEKTSPSAFRNISGSCCLRRFVDSTKHHRDAFLFRVSGKTKTLSLKFRDPVLGTEGDFGLRGSGHQAVITGIHPSGKRYLTSIKIDRIEDDPEVQPTVFARVSRRSLMRRKLWA